MNCSFMSLRRMRIPRLLAIAATLVSCGCSGGSSDIGEALPPVGSKIVFASDRTGNYEIYAMNPDGSRQTRLTRDAAVDFTPALSPDGTKIAFVSDRDGLPQIYVMDADGSNQTQLTQGPDFSHFPAFSPDGRRIVFIRYDGADNSVYVMNVDGSGAAPIATGLAYCYRPVFSPDGTKIAFMAAAGGYPSGLEVFLINADGSGLVQLTGVSAGPVGGAASRLSQGPPITLTGDPAFSPDGGKIIFVSDREGPHQIYEMSADGSNVRRLTNQETGLPVSYRNPSFSADGRTIVFQAYVPDDRNNEIGVMNADGSGLTLLTRNPASDQHPSMR